MRHVLLSGASSGCASCGSLDRGGSPGSSVCAPERIPRIKLSLRLVAQEALVVNREDLRAHFDHSSASIKSSGIVMKAERRRCRDEHHEIMLLQRIAPLLACIYLIVINQGDEVWNCLSVSSTGACHPIFKDKLQKSSLCDN